MVGIDIIRIKRVENAIKKQAFLTGVFSSAEIEYYKTNGSNPQTLAGIYAAKEAVIKAAGLSVNTAVFQQIEVLHLDSGKPYIKFSGDAAKTISQCPVDISISHDGEYAVAVALIL